MSHFVRQSKYRHVYSDPPKHDDCWTGFRLSTATGEQQYIKANPKFFAVALQGGGGPFAIVDVNQPSRYMPGTPVISGHSGAVLDFDWNPFHDNIIASCSDDCTIKVWGVPDEGLTETITDPLVDLRGHGRKVTLLRFHPTASNVLASTSADFTPKIWDIEKGVEMHSMDGIHDQLIQDMVWDHTGGLMATSCKDKSIRLIDPRASSVAQTIENAHDGSKSSKITFAGNKGTLVSVGFTKQSMRQIKVWDPRNGCALTKTLDIDQAAGVIIPFYDGDTNILYLAGKGDGNVRYYEFVDEDPWCFALSEFRSTTSAKGLCWVPKRGLDIMACETARALKLTSNSVEPLSFRVPRKSDAFQDDIFPDTFSGEPSHTADEWWGGSDKEPETMSLNPINRPQGGGSSSSFTPMKTPAQLTKELDEAQARIEFLEKKLQDAGISF